MSRSALALSVAGIVVRAKSYSLIKAELYVLLAHRDPGSYQSFNSDADRRRGVCFTLGFMVRFFTSSSELLVQKSLFCRQSIDRQQD